MQIIISGQHLNLGSLREWTEEHIRNVAHKYFPDDVEKTSGPMKAHIIVTKEHNMFKTHISFHDGHHSSTPIIAEDTDIDPKHSVQKTIDKIDRQLREMKDKLSNHRKKEEFNINASINEEEDESKIKVDVIDLCYKKRLNKIDHERSFNIK